MRCGLVGLELPQDCIIGVEHDSDGKSVPQSTNANWLDVYRAAVAVNTICVRKGLVGTAVNIG